MDFIDEIFDIGSEGKKDFRNYISEVRDYLLENGALVENTDFICKEPSFIVILWLPEFIEGKKATDLAKELFDDPRIHADLTNPNWEYLK